MPSLSSLLICERLARRLCERLTLGLQRQDEMLQAAAGSNSPASRQLPASAPTRQRLQGGPFASSRQHLLFRLFCVRRAPPYSRMLASVTFHPIT